MLLTIKEVSQLPSTFVLVENRRPLGEKKVMFWDIMPAICSAHFSSPFSPSPLSLLPFHIAARMISFKSKFYHVIPPI